jgi:hypothetical protein
MEENTMKNRTPTANIKNYKTAKRALDIKLAPEQSFKDLLRICNDFKSSINILLADVEENSVVDTLSFDDKKIWMTITVDSLSSIKFIDIITTAAINSKAHNHLEHTAFLASYIAERFHEKANTRKIERLLSVIQLLSNVFESGTKVTLYEVEPFKILQQPKYKEVYILRMAR